MITIRKLIFLVCLLLFFTGCERYKKGIVVKIKLGGSKGVIVNRNPHGHKYEVRYQDSLGTYHTSWFNTDEFEPYPGMYDSTFKLKDPFWNIF